MDLIIIGYFPPPVLLFTIRNKNLLEKGIYLFEFINGKL